MTGRRRLTWVTALTVASLLLGSGALNALAEGRGGAGGHGNSTQAKEEHQPAGAPAAVTEGVGHGDQGHGHAANDNASGAHNNHDARAPVATDDRAVTTTTEAEEVQDEDLVTPPARVTEEVRPGLGCGDADDHSGAPGNPDLKCRKPMDNDGDAATAADDQAATTDADDASVAVVSDDGSGD